ncbi:MAG: LPXTG cell wall anchor domain-containing protein [Lachnospiraceae bacterium]|nr:LPXTG cell wall anchor domain-containing protein [Lachnospiraceae bacterium]
MLKKVLSVIFAAALCVVATAGTSAQAAEIKLPSGCTWIYYDPTYDSYKVAAFNDAEGVPAGTITDDLSTIYACRVTVKAADTPDTALIINAESANWEQHDNPGWEASGDNYVATLKKDGPFSLFKTPDTYAQICFGTWGNVDIEVVGAEWLDKDGNVIKSYGVGAAGASLPKTGVVSAVVFYGLGSLLIGGGVVATKKAKKED